MKKIIKEHPFFVLSVISISLGLISWIYTKTYFDTLGVIFTFNHLDNLIFFFGQIINFGSNDIELSFKDHSLILILSLIPASIFCYQVVMLFKEALQKSKNLLKKIDNLNQEGKDILEIEKSIKDLETNSSKIASKLERFNSKTFIIILFFISIFSFNSLFIIITIIYKFSTTLLPLSIPALCLYFIFTVNKKEPFNRIFYPFAVILIALSIGGVQMVAKHDAEVIKKNEYSNLQNICLYKEKSKEWSRCGKLIYLDSIFMHIRFANNNFINSIRREKYEVSIIPNFNN